VKVIGDRVNNLVESISKCCFKILKVSIKSPRSHLQYNEYIFKF